MSSLSSRKRRISLLFRNVILRILLITTFVELSFTDLTDIPGWNSTVWWLAQNIGLPVLIILHHTLRLWPRRYWLVICELLVSLMEVTAIGYILGPITVYIIFSSPFAILAWMPPFFIAVFSSISLLFLLCDVLRDGRKNLRQPYNYSAGLCPINSQWSFICGNFATRKRFSTDNSFIRCIRGALAILCFFVILYLAVYSLILQPIRSRGRRFIKTYKVAVGLEGEDMNTVLLELTNDFMRLQAVLTVQNVSASYQYPTMSLVLVNEGFLLSDNCQNDSTSAGTVLVSCGEILLSTGPDTVTDILATIHFLEPSGNFQLYLGMTNSTGDILSEAEPISITPGSNVHAWSSISVQERLLNQGSATFGIPQYRRFAVINIRSPSLDLLPSLPRDNQTATLRVGVRLQPDIEVKQEYIENSVLSGFATVGGVWTLVNGVFAAIFGSTLLLVLFGIKPLSIYGLVHLFRPGRGSLADGGYILSPEERDRIVGILREHLLDVDDTEGDGTSSSRYSAIGILPQSNRSQCDIGVQT